MYIFKKILFILLIFIFVSPTLVLADGMAIAPEGYYVFETDQKAVIFYENGRESLVVSTSFAGNAKDFAWIIPSPSRPQVSKVSDEIFASLNDLTFSVYDEPRPMPVIEPGFNGTVLDKGVSVVETQQIEYYDITILEANDSDALKKWLAENGYSYPDKARYILDSYIQNGWYFTAIKINDEYLSNSIEGQLKTGHAVPLKLDFITKKIVYPLKISSVQVNNDLVPRNYYYPNKQVKVLLYVITENKQELPGFETQYAGWITGDIIQNLAYSDAGEPWIIPQGDKYFMTKLVRYMSKVEMTNDLYLRQSKDNSTVNAPGLAEERGFVRFIIVMTVGGVLMLILLIILIWSGRKKEYNI